MAYWNWGVNFNNHENDHYHYMRTHNFIIGSLPQTPYYPGDLVAVHKGHGLLAIAEVTTPYEPLQNRDDFAHLQDHFGCIAELTPIFAQATFKRVAPFMMGAAGVNIVYRQNMIQHIWDDLP